MQHPTAEHARAVSQSIDLNKRCKLPTPQTMNSQTVTQLESIVLAPRGVQEPSH